MRKKVYRRKMTESKQKVVAFKFQQAYNYFYSGKQAQNMRKPTLVSYKEHYNFFINWLHRSDYEVEFVEDLTVKIVRDYINYMQNEHYNFKTKKVGLGTLTINARIRFLKTWYSFLMSEKLIEENVMELISFLRVDERNHDLLTEDEMKRLLEAPDKEMYPQWRDIVLMHVLYDSSLRIHEAISLDATDINIINKQISLPASKAKDRRQRVIPISNITVKYLIKLMEENSIAFGETDAIFLNWWGERMAEDTFRRNLKRYLKKAGIDKNFSCHDFRRQSITEMLKNGASLFAVQKIAGHSQISTTRRYVQFDDETIKKQHEMYSPLNRIAYKKRR